MAAEMCELMQKRVDFWSINTKNGKYHLGESNRTYSLRCSICNGEEKKILFQKPTLEKHFL